MNETSIWCLRPAAVTVPATARLRLATRGSPLARAQAAMTASALRVAAGVTADELIVSTRGDRETSTPVAELEGAGWFTTEVEAALLDGRADVAVHSAKDLPGVLGEGLHIAAHLTRADPRDALLTRPGGPRSLADLAPGALVGTGSPRRQAWLRRHRPDLRVEPVRGNVDTRLRKLDAGEFDALVLACAGLDRLGQGYRITERLAVATWVPAPAQGAVALEVRIGGAAEAAVTLADDPATSLAVTAERSVLAALGGGCRLALGAHAHLDAGRLVLSAALEIEGGEIRFAQLDAEPGAAAALGQRVAERLRG